MTLNVVAKQTWKHVNQDLLSILLLTTSGFTINVVKRFEGNKAENATGDGYAAWETRNDKYDSQTKETGRACYEKMVNTKNQPGQDPDDLIFVVNG